MTEKRQIKDEELVVITGAGVFDDCCRDRGPRPEPKPGGGARAPEHDTQPHGDVEFGE